MYNINVRALCNTVHSQKKKKKQVRVWNAGIVTCEIPMRNAEFQCHNMRMQMLMPNANVNTNNK